MKIGRDIPDTVFENAVHDVQNTYFFAAFVPSVDFAGAFPAVEAGAFEAMVDAGLGGMLFRECLELFLGRRRRSWSGSS